MIAFSHPHGDREAETMTGSPSVPVSECQTYVDLLSLRAAMQPDRLAYRFLDERGRETATLTYGDLDRRAMAIAAHLQARSLHHERVLLLFPSGLDFVSAFFGCLYAGAIAVPAYPPKPGPIQERLDAISHDCGARALLTTQSQLPSLATVPALQHLLPLAVEALIEEPSGGWRSPGVHRESIAFLQYTSGSTAAPKGVVVSHHNLLENQKLIQASFEHDEESVGVGWLPLFHDLGLIGNMLQPVFAGFPVTLMSPMTFLKYPHRWLEAIARYGATTSGGPNFAFDYCVRKVTPEQRQALDLSTWSVAFTGAEPIQADTLHRFADAFGPCGFRREAFHPCYGLAEATLLVSTKARLEPVSVRDFEDGGRRRPVVANGCTWFDQEVRIVDPETGRELPEGAPGEIWVRGPNVCQGYWNRPEGSRETFEAFTDTGDGPFLRTGDVGTWLDGSLYIRGRLKDLIIVRGRNHFPQDLERTVEATDALVRTGGCAAFGLEVAGQERVVVVAELDRRSPPEAAEAARLVEAVRAAVLEAHDLALHDLVFIAPGAMPKTSSGKIQRRQCRDDYLEGRLKPLSQVVEAS
jgi:acyl-CoA synthetase (AMP-forming)/AMP-acid ligase II